MEPTQCLACIVRGSPEAVFSLDDEYDKAVIGVKDDTYQSRGRPLVDFQPIERAPL